MSESLFIYIGTEDTTSENAFAKLKVMKEVLRSVKEILWPTNGRKANVSDAVRLAVFRMSRSDVFKANHNVTCEPDGEESIWNDIFVSADATKSDNVEAEDVEKTEDERLISHLASILRSVLQKELCKKLNDSMGILGTDSKGKVVVGTTSGTDDGSVASNGLCDFYINAATPIGQGLPIVHFNILEKALFRIHYENISPTDAAEITINDLRGLLCDTRCFVIINEIGKRYFITKAKQTIWAYTNGVSLTSYFGGAKFTEEF